MAGEEPLGTNEMLEGVYIDPNAPSHKREIEQIINDTPFEFIWSRMLASELLYILAGQKETSDDTLNDGLVRMLQKAVSPSQKGLLINLLNDKANYTLPRKLIEGMLPLITDNETLIGKPECSREGDVKRFTVHLTTDNKVERFDFTTDRARFDEFQMAKEEAASDTAEELHNFLSDCLEDKQQKIRYNLLAFDERNFTLSIKLYSKVNSFLSSNQAITAKPTLKKSQKQS